MGKKANPYALRLIINKDWKSSYFVRGRKQAEIIKQDNLIREIINSVSRDIIQIKMERSSSEILIFITTSNLSYLTDKSNKNLDILIEKIKNVVENKSLNIKVNLIELKRVFSSSQYISNFIASRIESRTPFRVAVRNALSKTITQNEVKGIKIKISGRLDGSEIAKTEKFSQGKVPLSTLESVIDYSKSEAKATYGKIGISVWIYKGKFRERNSLAGPKKSFRKREFTENVNTQKN